eukprot:346928-Prymnesium_polylepis.1
MGRKHPALPDDALHTWSSRCGRRAVRGAAVGGGHEVGLGDVEVERVQKLPLLHQHPLEVVTRVEGRGADEARRARVCDLQGGARLGVEVCDPPRVVGRDAGLRERLVGGDAIPAVQPRRERLPHRQQLVSARLILEHVRRRALPSKRHNCPHPVSGAPLQHVFELPDTKCVHVRRVGCVAVLFALVVVPVQHHRTHARHLRQGCQQRRVPHARTGVRGAQPKLEVDAAQQHLPAACSVVRARALDAQSAERCMLSQAGTSLQRGAAAARHSRPAAAEDLTPKDLLFTSFGTFEV